MRLPCNFGKRGCEEKVKKQALGKGTVERGRVAAMKV